MIDQHAQASVSASQRGGDSRSQKESVVSHKKVEPRIEAEKLLYVPEKEACSN